jgi:hypothetical protein
MSWEAISCWIENHAGLSSWVQAVGSVLAIFTAVWIAHRDTALRRKSQSYARNGTLIRAQTVTGDAVERVESALEAANKYGANDGLLSSVLPHLEQCRQYLTEALAVHGLDSDIYAELFKARKSLEDVILLLPGIGRIDTKSTETTVLESMRAVNVKLLELQKS